MHTKTNIDDFTITGEKKFVLADHPHAIKDVYKDKDDYRDLLEEFREEIDDLQRMMYAQDRHSVLLVFQAMDAAGKDSTIRHIMSGVNVHGISVHPFKKPSDEELDHDFLWRTNVALPQRGRIGIFNRSYYEEVLVVRVHPQILTESQKLPRELTEDLDKVWKHRYESICDLERHLDRNGTMVLKFFLNVSRDEQRERFLDRIEEPDKNWKFSEADVKERGFWDDYMHAYEEAINATASHHAPWFVIPADDKRNMQLIVSHIIVERLKSLDMHYPVVSDARREELQHYREMLEKD